MTKSQDNCDEIVFPIGLMQINIKNVICENCGRMQPDEDMSNKRYSVFTETKERMLKNNHMHFEENPELYINEKEFQKNTGIEITNANRNWFSKGLFSYKKDNHLYILRQSMELYKKTGLGMFWLSENIDAIKKEGHREHYCSCKWCGVGDSYNGQCTYCGAKIK